MSDLKVIEKSTGTLLNKTGQNNDVKKLDLDKSKMLF